jgi:flagellar biosynthesis protein FlhF
MKTASLPTAPGTCIKFTVSTATEAAQVIREKLGENARVLSVRTVSAGGLTGFFSAPKLEVIAQLTTAAEEASTLHVSEETFLPPIGTATKPVTAGRRYGAPGASFQAEKNLGKLLRRSGFSETLLQRLEKSPAWITINELPLHRALVETGRHLCEMGAAHFDRQPLSRAAFLGTPGVGRTTALCKWLAAELFRRARMGHVITAEFDRPSATGPLSVFCEAMGVPLAHYPASTQPATPGGFVYFDMPGLSLRHPGENAAILKFIEREQIEQRVLVLNAAYEPGALRAAYAIGRDMGATHVVFTHLDEVNQWGRLWDYVLDGELEPLFLGTGPSLTGDCEENVLEAIARRTLPAGPEADEVSDTADTEMVAATFNTAA